MRPKGTLTIGGGILTTWVTFPPCFPWIFLGAPFIEKMRGNYCIGDVEERCGNGLLHHFVDGRLAEPGDGTLFCSGCNLQTLYVLGYRRGLANEPW